MGVMEGEWVEACLFEESWRAVGVAHCTGSVVKGEDDRGWKIRRQTVQVARAGLLRTMRIQQTGHSLEAIQR